MYCWLVDQSLSRFTYKQMAAVIFHRVLLHISFLTCHFVMKPVNKNDMASNQLVGV